MTLTRSNPEAARVVIDRNDDSASRPIRVGIVAASGIFTDVLINALLGSRIAAWRLSGDTPAIALRDQASNERPDLVVFIDDEDAQPHDFTDRGMPVMLVGRGDAAIARSWIEAGEVSVVDPSAADIDDLVSAIHGVAGQSVAPPPDWRRQIDEARRTAQAEKLNSVSIINSDDATN